MVVGLLPEELAEPGRLATREALVLPLELLLVLLRFEDLQRIFLDRTLVQHLAFISRRCEPQVVAVEAATDRYQAVAEVLVVEQVVAFG